MPGITEEWKLHSSDINLNYNIRIFEFGHKMKTWRAGREVHSLPFQVGESEFSLAISPNGDCKENRGNISVFLRNRNDWDVRVACELSVGTMSFKLFEQIGSNSSHGWPKYCDHDEVRDLDDFRDYGHLTVTADIKLIWEEVTPMMKSTKSEVSNLKRKIDALEGTMTSKLVSLENIVAKKLKPTSPCPECPICFDDMKPPTKIVQCMSGP